MTLVMRDKIVERGFQRSGSNYAVFPTIHFADQNFIRLCFVSATVGQQIPYI